MGKTRKATHAARRLTELFVSNLKPEAERYEVPDLRQPGLRIRVFPSGVKSWSFMYRSPATRVWTRLTLGQFPALGIKDARKLAQKAAGKVAVGGDPAAEKQKERAQQDKALRLRVENVVDEFKQVEVHGYRPNWARETNRILDREILPRWKRRLISQITENDVADIQAEINERNAPVMAARVVQVIKLLFAFARRPPRRYVMTSPAAEITVSNSVKRQHYLSDDEIRAVWHATDKLGTYGQIIKLLLLTGLRLNEVAGLRWSEVNFAERVLIIPPERVKTDTALLVPLSDPAGEILRSVPRDGERVFTTERGYSFGSWSRWKRKLDGMLGNEVRPWRVHDLRRTVRTNLSKLRVPPHVAEAVLGHVAPAIVRTYDVHDLADEKRHALEAWANRLDLIVNCAPTNVVSLLRA